MTDLLTAQEVAERLQVSESWIKKLAQRRQIPHYKVAGKLRFRWTDVNRFVEQQKVAPTPRGGN